MSKLCSNCGGPRESPCGALRFKALEERHTAISPAAVWEVRHKYLSCTATRYSAPMPRRIDSWDQGPKDEGVGIRSSCRAYRVTRSRRKS